MPVERKYKKFDETEIPPKDTPTWLHPDLFDESKKNETVFCIRSLDRNRIYSAIKYILFGLSQETDGWDQDRRDIALIVLKEVIRGRNNTVQEFYLEEYFIAVLERVKKDLTEDRTSHDPYGSVAHLIDAAWILPKHIVSDGVITRFWDIEAILSPNLESYSAKYLTPEQRLHINASSFIREKIAHLQNYVQKRGAQKAAG